MSEPACTNRMHLFFEPDGHESNPDRQYREASARDLCRSCPVQRECFDGANERREGWGIWGGYTASELANMRRREARSRWVS